MPKNTEPVAVSRRSLLKVGAGVVGTGTLTGWLGSHTLSPNPSSNSAMAAEPVVNSGELTPDQALKKLLDGNKRFMARKRQNPNQDLARVTEVAKEQKPFAAVLSCADSRVPLEILFDQGIGDLFVVRVAGNISSTEDIASEEFGTLVLGAKVLLVMGHERCGAVQAALKGGEFPGLIGSLVYAIKPAVDASVGKPGDPLENAIKANVLLQMKRLQTSPVIATLVQQGKLKVVGGYYDLDTGAVILLPSDPSLA
ncbi:MAG: carbonic anhydrase [Acaryochloris sp. SU_5_25]|nr:carbonic anhydrase [Acaryochloris sp. SU_5_25]